MSASKLFNIFALSTLAVLLCSFAPSSTVALTVRANHQAARHVPNHHGIAKKKKKRDTCKPKPGSSTPASSPPANNANYNTPTSTPPADSPVPSTTTSSYTPSQTPSSNSGPGKLGIAWALGDDPRVQILLSAPRVKIFHIWDAVVPSSLQNSGHLVSIMLWSTSQDRINNFVQHAQPGYATHAYGMNEVNEPTQAYTSVPDAISAWYSYIRPLANSGYILGSPCTTSAPDGFDWVTQFMQQCGDDCHVDEVPIHWYDVQFADFQTYVNKWASAFKKPVRITEFACQNFNGPDQPSPDQIWSFTEQAIGWLEGNGDVLSYAPFGFMDGMYNVNDANRLFSPDGLTPLGWLYVNGHS